MDSTKAPLLGKTLDELTQIVLDLGMPKFTAGQIASWLYGRKVASIDEMTNLSVKNRERLKECYEVGATAPVHEMRSVDGTVKYLPNLSGNRKQPFPILLITPKQYERT